MRSYQVKKETADWRGYLNVSYLLSGLFTSTSDGLFWLHYLCPLCDTQINVTRKPKSVDNGKQQIDYEKFVWGEMVHELKAELHNHYPYECATTRERRTEGARVLLDKYMDEVYE